MSRVIVAKPLTELEKLLSTYAQDKALYNGLYSILGDYRQRLTSHESRIVSLVREQAQPLSQSEIDYLVKILKGGQ